jgi:hypothetical protein
VADQRVSVASVDQGQADDLATAVRDLQRLVAAQAAQIAELRTELNDQRAQIDTGAESAASPDLPVTGRRRFLALAGGAAAAAMVGGASSPAAALNGEDIRLAVLNSATPGIVTSTTILDYSPATRAQVDYLRVTDSIAAISSVGSLYTRYLPAAVAGHARTTPEYVLTGVTGLSEVSGGNGVLGIATGSGGSYGVWGISETGNGVVGRSLTGYDFFGEGAGRIGLAAHVFVGPPASGTYAAGDIIRDSQGALWACVVSGGPGVWRMLAGPTTAGVFSPVVPTRVYDSRAPEPIEGRLDTGASRTISVAHGRDPLSGDVVISDLVPAGATAIACNVTVTDAIGSGYAVVNPGVIETIGASTINWQPGQVLANSIIVGIDDARQVTLVAGGGGSTNIVLDVAGYFR